MSSVFYQSEHAVRAPIFSSQWPDHLSFFFMLSSIISSCPVREFGLSSDSSVSIFGLAANSHGTKFATTKWQTSGKTSFSPQNKIIHLFCVKKGQSLS